MKFFHSAFIWQLILSIYVLIYVWKLLPGKKTKLFVTAIIATETIVYIVGLLFKYHMSPDLLGLIMQVCSTYTVAVITISNLLILSHLIFWIVKRRNKPHKEVLARYRLRYFVGALLVTVVLLAVGHYTFRNPSVTEHAVSIDKQSATVKNLKIVYFSDIHLGYQLGKDRLREYVQLIMDQKPDIIFLGGDLIDHNLTPLVFHRMDEELNKLKAPLGVYMCMGNHEYFDNIPEKIEWLEKQSAITLLRDSVVEVAGSFYVVGRDDRKVERKNLDELLVGLDPSKPVIVLNHQPVNLREEVDNKADMAFYGHTHNGQLFPANLILDFLYEMPYGYKKNGQTNLFVSSGLGIGGPQFRIGTQSEIVVVDVTFADRVN